MSESKQQKRRKAGGDASKYLTEKKKERKNGFKTWEADVKSIFLKVREVWSQKDS